MKKISLQINNKVYEANDGETIIQVTKKNRIPVPTLCHWELLSPFGQCRMCVVEVDGNLGPVTACNTPVWEGMDIVTESDNIAELRKNNLRLILANHPNDCMTCERTGMCKLQNYAYKYDVHAEWSQQTIRKFSEYPNNGVIEWDRDKCIMCARCARTCAELQGSYALGFKEGGFTALGTPNKTNISKLGDCELCGQCIEACPVGALTELSTKGKGRVWEFEKTRTTCTYCGTGCNYFLNVKDDKVVSISPCFDAPVNDRGSLCVKGRFGYEHIHHKDRITTPLIRKNGKLEEASWDEAINLIATRFKEIKEKHGPDSLGFLSSSRCTNEENYIFQKLGRMMGTNNIDNCARVCHSASVSGLAACYGGGAATNSFSQIRDAELLFVIGANPYEAHPILGLKIKDALKKDTKLIVGDPRRTQLAEIADVWLNLIPGTNIALLNGIIHVIIKEGLEDSEFIRNRTEGFEELKKGVEKYTPEYVSGITGVAKDRIIDAARMYATTDKAMIIYSLGMTEHTTGTYNVMALGNLATVTGHLGRASVGINPTRGQNNVQGACDMGALPDKFVGYQKVGDKAAQAKFEKAWGVKLDDKVGLTCTEMDIAMNEGKLKGYYIFGEDPAMTNANVNFVKSGLRKLEFLVVQDILPTETTEFAHVVLPGSSHAEKDGTFTNGERRIQLIRKAIEPLCGKADWETICLVANALGVKMDYTSASEIWDELASVAPMFAGVTHKKLGKNGIQWPCPDIDHPGTEIMYTEKFITASGKAKFNFNEHIASAEVPDDTYPLILTTGRRRQHYNNGSMTRRSSKIYEKWPEEVLELNPFDAKRFNITDSEKVLASSRRGEMEIRVHLTDRVQPGITFLAFHHRDALTNLLTNDAFDPICKIPELKSCAIKVEKLNGNGCK
ncbi:MAG: formate dehydrogenase subunit alpha [Candidatus Scalindua sp.]|nr:formate dehydrogenase subunit alpha [Candidatus Scalindua sp.]